MKIAQSLLIKPILTNEIASLFFLIALSTLGTDMKATKLRFQMLTKRLPVKSFKVNLEFHTVWKD